MERMNIDHLKTEYSKQEAEQAQGLEQYPQDSEPNEYRYIDYRWLDKVAEGLTAGARKHPGETWRDIPTREHAVRALRHLSLYLAGDTSEPHLINASMRCMMAFAMTEEAEVTH